VSRPSDSGPTPVPPAGTGAPPILILGVGNVLLRDEAVGVRAVEELERRYVFPPEVELLDGGTSGIELLRHLEGRERLILLDAVRSGHPPGTVLRMEGEDVPKKFMTRISPHQLGISDLLAAAQLTDELPPELLLLGVEPERMDMALGLTPAVAAGLERLLDRVLEELRRLGVAPRPRAKARDAGGTLWQ